MNRTKLVGGKQVEWNMSSVDARALRLFDNYVDMSPAQREGSLAALQREDPDLHSALLVLLQADACIQPIDRAPVAAIAARMQMDSDTASDERIGKQAGSWRIVGIIGHGGMGTVYRVERVDNQYKQTAALKYVRAEVSSHNLIEAFLDERNVLASMSHPGIVPLLDGGVDEDGQPWFVMQEVDGEPIDQWCNRKKLPIRDRVELFMRACDAVVYAHARGILHQDIKPSNLLVTQDGHVQLLDFGLSIPVAGGVERKRLAVTSGYTAPEVMRCDPPGFGVDIYSLGVLLSRLLFGQWPVSLNSSIQKPYSVADMVEQMTPSMLAERGVSNQRSMKGVVSGELESIVLHSIEADPGDRFASIDQMRTDLQNWLTGYPVASYGGGYLYRIRRFARRHAYLSATLAVAVCALIAIGSLFLWQRSQAEREQVAASHVDRLLESSMGMATLSGLGDIPLTPAAMLQRSEDHLRRESLPEQADVRSRGFSVLARSWAVIGDYAKAEELAHEASEQGSDDELLRAFNMATLAQIQNQRAHYAQAEASVRKGQSLLPLGLPGQYRLARVRLLDQLAAAQSGQGKSRDAFHTLSSAISESEKLPPSSGDAVVAQLLTQRGTWYRWRFRMTESEADLQRAIELTKDTDPVIADDARESLVRTVRASRRPGREERSLKLANELLESRTRTLGDQHLQTGVAWSELAFIRLLNADGPGAEQAVANARAILGESIGQQHPTYARTCIAEAFVMSLSGRIDEAIEQAERGLDIYGKSLGSTHEFTLEARFLLASLRWSQFSRTGDEIRRTQATDIMREAIDQSVQIHGVLPAIHRMAYANLLANSGNHVEAAKQLRQAHADAIWQYGEKSQEALHMRSTEISMAIDDDRDPQWMENEFSSLIVDVDSIDTLYARAIAHSAWLERGRWLRKQGRVVDAKEAFVKARDEAERAGQPGWIQVADIKLKELEGEGSTARH